MSEFTFKLPDLGEGTVEAEIAEWMVKVGDVVNEEDPICAMLTDKAAVELTAPVGGTVISVAGEEGDTVSVSCESPVPLSEFLKMAQLITQGRYTFHRDDADAEISWVGKLTCDRKDFGEFVQTMLYVKGLALESRQHGDSEILEVIAIKRD